MNAGIRPTLCAVLLLVGCGKIDTSDGSGGAPSVGGQPATGGSDGCDAKDDLSACREKQRQLCGTRTLVDCEALSFCAVIDAWPINESSDCAEPAPEAVGCGLALCDTAISHGRDPAGSEWLFPSTCQPYGFTDLGPSAAVFCEEKSDLLQICSEMPLESCNELPYCDVLRAWPIDGSRDCTLDQFDVVGCGLLGCGDSITRSLDPDGNAWLFPSTCQPYGWTDLGFDDAQGCSALGGAGGAGP
jgi:hypothetical protein